MDILLSTSLPLSPLHAPSCQIKKRKLEDQFQDMCQDKKTEIFKGVTIYVNGWTQPDADELKRLMHAHGGNYVYNLWSRSRVTHIIATNLPNVKVRKIGDTVVCSPEWIVDSIAARRQLPVLKYQLYSQNGSGQKRLRFKRIGSKKRKDEASAVEEPDASVPALNPLENLANPVGSTRTEARAPGVQRKEADAVTASAMPSPALDRIENLANSVGSPRRAPGVQQSRKQEVAPPPLLQPSPPRSVVPPRNRSSRGGAEFVQEFFTHSRLHYLSTWSSELKQFTSKMLTQIRPKYPKLPPSASLRAQKLRAIIHIDIDCFFVSVSIRDKPHLRGKPVAVTHAKGRAGKGKEKSQPDSHRKQASGRKVSPKAKYPHPMSASGNEPSPSVVAEPPSIPDSVSFSSVRSAESSSPPRLSGYLLRSVSDIASCSYEARRAGVRNGMWVGQALKLCPDLELVPYDFDTYHQVSCEFYKTLLGYSSVVEAVSCDEVYIELTDYADSMEQVQNIVQALRAEVQEKTGCNVSAGISHNMLLARMATRLAKPNGQFYLPRESLQDFLSPQPVHDLPGVGYSLSTKLRDMRVETCSQLKSIPLSKLQAEFGTKTGRMLYDYSRGMDSREFKLEPERKSLSVDINFGIRFADASEAGSFLVHLATEVEKRAEEAQVLASSITLKLKVRKPEASVNPQKYLGHGSCDNLSRSHPLPHPTRSASEIGKVAGNLLKQLNLLPSDIRGVGIQLNKLVPGRPANERPSGTDIRSMISKGASLNRARLVLKCLRKCITLNFCISGFDSQMPFSKL